MLSKYQSLVDLLNPKKEELMTPIIQPEPEINMSLPPAEPEPSEAMSKMSQEQMDELNNANEQQNQQPEIPDNTPIDQVLRIPQLSDILPPKQETANQEQPQTPMLAQATPAAASMQETPLSRLEALMQQYRGEDQKSLEEARRRDRMLKVGGALGDALATYLNARSQMNVKAPGVQVQQGAGLGQIADMFATAPEIASDVKARREALLKQYEALAKKEAVEAGIKSKEKIAEQKLKKEEKREKESPSAWQIVPIVRNGVQQYVSVNKMTNEIRPIGERATYQQFRIDPGTGNIVAYNPLLGTQAAPTILPEKKQALDTELKGEEPKMEESMEESVDLTKETFNKLNPNQKKLLQKTREKFNDDTKDERNVLGSIASIKRTLEMAPNNAAAANAFGTQLAKLYQDGRLSDKDVDLYIKNKALAQRIKSSFFEAIKGTMDPELVPVYKELISEMETGISNEIDNKADYFATQNLGNVIDNREIRKELIYPKQALQYKTTSKKPKEISRRIVKTQYSPSRNKTKIIYSDGTEEIVDGKQQPK